jgi:RNA polymerase sigma-70 factor (ECF subfamily)
MSSPATGAIAIARARYPDVAYTEADFVKDGAHLPLSRIDPERVGDLYLAFACVRGDAKAIAHFENTVIARLDGALARIDPRPEAMDEARQRVRARLLVASPGRPPRLSEYRGEAPLWSWVKTVAVRFLIDAARENHRAVTVGDEVLANRLVTSGRVDLRFVQEAHRPGVTRAFEQALAALDPKERNVLRLAHVEGQSIDRIAALYATHRATAARWVIAAREKVAAGTRLALQEALRLDGTELDSLLQALDGNLEQSLRHYFDDDDVS